MTAFTRLFQMMAHADDPLNPKNPNPALVRKISLNTGNSAYFGTKYSVETVSIAS